MIFDSEISFFHRITEKQEECLLSRNISLDHRHSLGCHPCTSLSRLLQQVYSMHITPFNGKEIPRLGILHLCFYSVQFRRFHRCCSGTNTYLC